MILIKHDKILIIFIFLLLFNIPVLSGNDRSLKVIPLPQKELEKAMTSWLINSGFDVNKSDLKMGRIKLIAAKKDKKWQLILKPYSALATEVQSEFTDGDEPGQNQHKALWDHISEYTQNTKTPEKDISFSNQVIPNEILSQIEAVVCIQMKVDGNAGQFSGFIVDAKDGLVITTAHDLKDIQKLTVILYDGRQFIGQVIKIDPHRDLAIIHVDSSFDNFISLADGRNLLSMGEKLYSVGCPINLGGSVQIGIINGPPRRANDLPLWQVSMKILPGSSGSPIFDARGSLVAVVKGRHRVTESVGFLIPLETIMDFVKER